MFQSSHDLFEKKLKVAGDFYVAFLAGHCILLLAKVDGVYLEGD